ncbi:hypothetical protein NHX12_018412 [Muraenolepis orangiensis]|uniref:Reverse transcriptase domain-containing protein n=1 Tax=Muraenolepis orangiensis TaxID=630683 RepID=A0A9Q0EWD0_9TELE|nr:hypothetical protein NHX12_018412 [Muraenolepis orangiensis]
MMAAAAVGEWQEEEWLTRNIQMQERGSADPVQVLKGLVAARIRVEPIIRWVANVDVNLSGDFTTADLSVAICKLMQSKSPGRDNIQSELVIHPSATTSAWLCVFFLSCFRRSKIPKTWRHAAVITPLKSNKPAEDPKAYRPISLLCVPFMILERTIHRRIEAVVDPQLPRKQGGSWWGRSHMDQETLLMQDIEDSFQAKDKAGVVLLDVTAAYDTVIPAMASKAGFEV